VHIVAYLQLWDILSSVSTAQRCNWIHSTACECCDTLSTVVFCENMNPYPANVENRVCS